MLLSTLHEQFLNKLDHRTNYEIICHTSSGLAGTSILIFIPIIMLQNLLIIVELNLPAIIAQVIFLRQGRAPYYSVGVI